MNFIYQYAYNGFYHYSNKLLDYLLYYKITIEENEIIKNIIKYIYPDDIRIFRVKLCNMDESKIEDITKKFIKFYEKNELTWNNLCHDYTIFDDNFDYSVMHIEVCYQFKSNNYRIIYNYKDDPKITFPPYNIEQLEVENDFYINKPIFAELNNNDGIRMDITDIIKEYAGPLENFYNDKCKIIHKIKVKYIKNKNGGFMLSENDFIKITDSFANDKIFEYHDILIL